MNLELDDTRVLVTAGASGIGLAIAREFVREGARVYVCDVDSRALGALSASAPADRAVTLRRLGRSCGRRMFDAALAHLGGLDVLVNNAGIAGPDGAL